MSSVIAISHERDRGPLRSQTEASVRRPERRHPAVLFASVVAKPDPKWGEVPCAFVELKDGARATEAEIIAFCRSHMSGFKTPKAVVFGSIPKTSTGKIQKFLLRNQVDSAKAISA
jgi:fatty-acyl-CoA synthase